MNRESHLKREASSQRLQPDATDAAFLRLLLTLSDHIYAKALWAQVKPEVLGPETHELP